MIGKNLRREKSLREGRRKGGKEGEVDRGKKERTARKDANGRQEWWTFIKPVNLEVFPIQKCRLYIK